MTDPTRLKSRLTGFLSAPRHVYRTFLTTCLRAGLEPTSVTCRSYSLQEKQLPPARTYTRVSSHQCPQARKSDKRQCWSSFTKDGVGHANEQGCRTLTTAIERRTAPDSTLCADRPGPERDAVVSRSDTWPSKQKSGPNSCRAWTSGTLVDIPRKHAGTSFCTAGRLQWHPWASHWCVVVDHLS